MAGKILEKTKVECKYVLECPDIKMLDKSNKRGILNEELTEQYHELCLSASPETCSIYQDFERENIRLLKERDIGMRDSN